MEYENGQPKNIPDDQRSKFKTRNGRIVLDGGGVTPDIKSQAPELSDLTKALTEKNVIFHYVTRYVMGKDSISSPETFEFTEFADFEKFCSDKKFTYQTKVEKSLEEVLVNAGLTGQKELIQNDITSLKQKISKEKEKAWTTYKEEIIREIEKEIVSRYYLQSGKVRYALNVDPEIKEAIQVLHDTKRYQQILTKK
ncbi:MAG: hypothetical protein IPN79_17850 [Saprospiraceae bacterium]|nr:hypothetical protein [Saprospiraceae bacterium]